MSLMRDHVSQVYLGLLDIGPTGDWLRRRIDWMAEEARGPRVLDVGCSEGILGVLLARRGIEVTGVDTNPEVLDFAGQLLAKEAEEVRNCVTFVQGDFTGTQPVTGLFRHRGDGRGARQFRRSAPDIGQGPQASSAGRAVDRHDPFRSASSRRQSPGLYFDGTHWPAQTKAGAGVTECRR